MSVPERNMVGVPRRSALHREVQGFAVTVLPASPYEVSYVPAHHVIGFTFEWQRGVDAFGSARRRPFDAAPWRLAFTPAGCALRHTLPLFDHLVGATEQWQWYVEAKRLGGFEIDH